MANIESASARIETAPFGISADKLKAASEVVDRPWQLAKPSPQLNRGSLRLLSKLSEIGDKISSLVHGWQAKESTPPAATARNLEKEAQLTQTLKDRVIDLAAGAAAGYIAKNVLRLVAVSSGVGLLQLALVGAGGGIATSLTREYIRQRRTSQPLDKSRLLKSALIGGVTGAAGAILGTTFIDFLADRSLALLPGGWFSAVQSSEELTAPQELPVPPQNELIAPQAPIQSQPAITQPLQTMESQLLSPLKPPILEDSIADLPVTGKPLVGTEEIVRLKKGGTIWDESRRFLQDVLGREITNSNADKTLIQEVAMEVSRQSDVTVPEWKISGRVLANKLPEDYALKFNQAVKNVALAGK